MGMIDSTETYVYLPQADFEYQSLNRFKKIQATSKLDELEARLARAEMLLAERAAAFRVSLFAQPATLYA